MSARLHLANNLCCLHPSLFSTGSAVFFAHSTVVYNYERAFLGEPPKSSKNPLWLLWWALKVFLTKQGLDFLAMAFLWLTWKECVAAWASVYYLPLLYMIAVLVLGNVFPVNVKKGEKKAAAGPAGDGSSAAAAADVAAAAAGNGENEGVVSGDHLYLGEGIKSALVDGAASRQDLTNGLKQE
jgi:hypothetical protein